MAAPAYSDVSVSDNPDFVPPDARDYGITAHDCRNPYGYQTRGPGARKQSGYDGRICAELLDLTPPKGQAFYKPVCCKDTPGNIGLDKPLFGCVKKDAETELAYQSYKTKCEDTDKTKMWQINVSTAENYLHDAANCKKRRERFGTKCVYMPIYRNKSTGSYWGHQVALNFNNAKMKKAEDILEGVRKRQSEQAARDAKRKADIARSIQAQAAQKLKGQALEQYELQKTALKYEIFPDLEQIEKKTAKKTGAAPKLPDLEPCKKYYHKLVSAAYDAISYLGLDEKSNPNVQHILRIRSNIVASLKKETDCNKIIEQFNLLFDIYYPYYVLFNTQMEQDAEQKRRLAEEEARLAEQEARLAEQERLAQEEEERLAEEERRLAEEGDEEEHGASVGQPGGGQKQKFRRLQSRTKFINKNISKKKKLRKSINYNKKIIYNKRSIRNNKFF
jgi:hypothetical protein